MEAPLMFRRRGSGRIVRSSMISIGAVSDPARSSRAGIGGLFRTHSTGNLDTASADLATDDRGGDRHCPFRSQQDGHALIDRRFAGDVLEDARSRRVEWQECWLPSWVLPSKPGCASVRRSP